jgi:hypothetical protein
MKALIGALALMLVAVSTLAPLANAAPVEFWIRL